MRIFHQRLLSFLPGCGPLVALLLVLFFSLLTACSERSPKALRLAVDASFVPALESLREDFERRCHCTLHITAGASGLLYSQIRAGADFDIFLSADAERPAQLFRDGLTVPASLQTYARGQLALWVSRRLLADASSSEAPDIAMLANLPAAELTPRQLILVLGRGKHKVIVADPQLAPDGDAAVKMLKGLRLWPRMRERMVYANHGGHAQIMLLQGEGDMGLVPYSQAMLSGSGGEFMRVPSRFYPAMNQQLIILRRTRERTLAIQFVQFLLSAPTQERLPDVGFLPAGRINGR
ncbi:molybdate ABC transporter substrate-binding protein [Microbulbifer aggregans]|uniref:molybdate ABC transporter substrate-binding protein n=1 Tax=Microbulbifer aggregans TaxID=1769779 RepID=UPI001CFD7294|nr:molybdate ABC transporter substrate-binding protein [Microbulbifer aggregans]